MRITMTILALSAFSLVLGASCVDRSESKAEPQDEAESKSGSKSAHVAPEPSAEAVLPAQPTALPPAPLTGTHIDGEGSGYRPASYQARPQPQTQSKGKTIELVLRSTPPGAIASIDGKAIGNTPTYWRGSADGLPHEYTFTKNGYSMARYRFVSTQSGVVHGSLKALVVGSEDRLNVGH